MNARVSDANAHGHQSFYSRSTRMPSIMMLLTCRHQTYRIDIITLNVEAAGMFTSIDHRAAMHIVSYII